MTTSMDRYAEALAVLDLFAFAADCGSRRSAMMRLGHSGDYLRKIEAERALSPFAYKALMKRFWHAWPKGASRPYALQKWERLHPQDVKDARSKPAEQLRRCMACGQEFLSEGPHNRLCDVHRKAGHSFDHAVAIPRRRA